MSSACSLIWISFWFFLLLLKLADLYLRLSQISHAQTIHSLLLKHISSDLLSRWHLLDWLLLFWNNNSSLRLSVWVSHELLNKFSMFTYLNLILIFSTASKADRSMILRQVKSLMLRQFAVCFLSIYHLISYLDDIS